MTLYKRTSSFVGARIDDEFVLMSVESGKYFGFGSVGASIWEALNDPISIDSLVNLICDNYEVSEHDCRPDVNAFIEDLVAHKLVSKL